MARNGSGTYNLASGNPVITGTTISSSWANNTLSDIASALTQSISADGQTPITANIGFNGFQLQGVADGVLNTDAMTVGQGVTATALADTSNASTGDALIGVKSTFTGGTARTQHDKNAEYLSVKDFGAIGNGTADDTAAIAAAITAGAGRRIYFPAGNYKTSSLLTVSAGNTILIGDGQQSTNILGSVNNTGVLAFTGVNCGLEGINVGYSVTPVSGATAILSTSFAFNGRDIGVSSAYVGIDISVNGKLSQLQILNCVSSGIYAHNAAGGDIYVNRFIINAGNTSNGTAGNIRLLNQVEAIIFSDGDVLLGVYPMTVDAASNTLGARPAYSRFNSVYFDSAVNGTSLNNCVDLTFTNCWFSNRPNNGCDVLTSEGVTFIGCTFFGSDKHGCTLSATSKHTTFSACKFISNSSSSANTYHGINIAANCTDFIIENCTFTNGWGASGSQGYGVLIAAGTSDRYVIRGNAMAGNGLGGLSDGGTGTNKFIDGNNPYNPIGSTVITPTGSPFTFTNNSGALVNVALSGGTVSLVTVNGAQAAGGSNTTVTVPQGRACVVTYTVAPSMSYYQ